MEERKTTEVKNKGVDLLDPRRRRPFLHWFIHCRQMTGFQSKRPDLHFDRSQIFVFLNVFFFLDIICVNKN